MGSKTKILKRATAVFVFVLFFLTGSLTAFAAEGTGTAAAKTIIAPSTGVYALSGYSAPGASILKAKAKASNKLKSLSVSDGKLSPAFNPNTTEYTLKLDEDTNSVTISAAAQDRKAKVSPASKTTKIKAGDKKTLKIVVKPKSGKSKTYTIKLSRAKSTNANLKSITTNSSRCPVVKVFRDGDVGYYTITLPYDVGSVTLSPNKSSVYSSYVVKATKNGVTTKSSTLSLDRGQMGSFTVTVKSQAGNTREYYIVVDRLKAPSDWQLAWSDEFDGSGLDTGKWTANNAPENSNGTQQHYTADNVSVSGGNLVLTAKSDNSSGWIDSKKKYGVKYGKIEARAKLPQGNVQGFFPAIWLWQSVSGTEYNETDIMEFIGKYPNRVYANNHFQTSNGVKHTYGLLDKIDLSGYHTYTVVWTENRLKWYFDDTLYYTTTENVPQDTMYLIVNLALGGVWGGPTNESTTFPNTMDVDYIRVYK
jgi:hypothetical protein